MGWLDKGDVPFFCYYDKHDPLFSRADAAASFSLFAVVSSVTVFLFIILVCVTANAHLSEYTGKEIDLFNIDMVSTRRFLFISPPLLVILVCFINGVYGWLSLRTIQTHLASCEQDDEYWIERERYISHLRAKEYDIDSNLRWLGGTSIVVFANLIAWCLYAINENGLLNEQVAENILTVITIISGGLVALGISIVKSGMTISIKAAVYVLLVVDFWVFVSAISSPIIIGVIRFFSGL